MAVEDSMCLAWNTEYRRELDAFDRQTRARSTPIQRAMDPRGVAAAQELTCASRGRSNQPGVIEVQPGAWTAAEQSTSFGCGRKVTLERARRREAFRGHLDSIYAHAAKVGNVHEASTLAVGLGKKSECGDLRAASGGTHKGAFARESQATPGTDRVGPARRDEAECDLTMDMLSHLGPLQDLTGLELCVEGLTSTSLLQACTSLKSLSLNVNRLSSPADLDECTTIARLGLR